ncbi:hypothetical protein JAAARDRAFT_36195 [Jaapia argillacea MUCL 33604]|uniref:DUF7587 domain-containing protein n=1 Tax=Jaapia argillacea MUCL 33604 TaxID=933084 RepID=A0A067PPJ3_9AGAM|nr:hypothetical protein JAAARDRAFT_36195 [Jaapia argillacea MUCL 33604]
MTHPHSQSAGSRREPDVLPQYGFGTELSFDKIVENNPFLFRVYTPRPLSPFFDSTDPFFVGQSFREKTDVRPSTVTYDDAVRHLDWTTRSTSPFISASYSFAWAIWEAVRRYKINVKHDVEIAIIDAKAVAGRAVTALEVLSNCEPDERHENHWKFYRFAHEAQDVLVFGYIPGTAVLASIPLLSILPSLPSYFLRNPITPDLASSNLPHPLKPLRPHLPHSRSSSLSSTSTISSDPFSELLWDTTQRKYSYRQFCRDASDKFHRGSSERRLADTTAGSVRLAVCLMRPWFHEKSMDDMEWGTEMLYRLALLIASWPGRWWIRDHVEVPEILRDMVDLIGEEIREARRAAVSKEVDRLQGIVEDLGWLLKQKSDSSERSEMNAEGSDAPASDHDEEDTLKDSDDEASVLGHHDQKKQVVFEKSVRFAPLPSHGTDEKSIQVTPGPEDSSSSHPHMPSFDKSIQVSSLDDPVEIPSVEKSVQTVPVEESSRSSGSAVSREVQPKSSPHHAWTESLEESDGFSLSSAAQSAITGFLVGTFAALCILAPHRREIMTHIT